MEKTREETIAAIKKAKEILEEISEDEHERELAEYREKYIRDQKASEDYGFDRGLEQGRTEGKREIIKSMHEKGMKLEDICDIVDLSKEKVEEILKS